MPTGKPIRGGGPGSQGRPVHPGDLQAVHGIGPKAETALKAAGIEDLGQLARTVTAHQGPVRVEARLLGPFELLVTGQPLPHWRGSRGRMLLAYLLLHRTRALNQPHLAVRRYHQCERQLRDELGVAPAEATRQLNDRIRRREVV